MAESSQQKPSGCSTICLPIDNDLYQRLIGSPQQFRRWLDQAFGDAPELFPKAFAQGYLLKDVRTSAKLGVRLRRSECQASGQAFTVRPSFVTPYLTGYTDDVEKALFLRRFGVPFWGLAYVFGKGPMYWYRLEAGLGRNSIVGTSVRRTPLPAGVNLARLIGPPPRVKLLNPLEWAVLGGDEGQSVDSLNLGENRGIEKVARRRDDPVRKILARLRQEFEVAKAVRFAHQGK